MIEQRLSEATVRRIDQERGKVIEAMANLEKWNMVRLQRIRLKKLKETEIQRAAVAAVLLRFMTLRVVVKRVRQ